MSLFGYGGYREASRFARENGRRAFGIPAWGWAVITAVSLLIGALLLHLAGRSAKKKQAPLAMPQIPRPSATFGSLLPDAQQGANVWAAPAPIAPQSQFPVQQTAPWPPTTTASRDILPEH